MIMLLITLVSYNDFYIHSLAVPGREMLHHVDEIWGPPRMVPIKRTFNSAIVINFIVEQVWDTTTPMKY